MTGREGWTHDMSKSQNLAYYTHNATKKQVWITEGESKIIKVETEYAKTLADIALNTKMAVEVDMRASPLVAFTSITREEGNSMLKRKAPEQAVVSTRTDASPAASRWVRLSQEQDGEKRSFVAMRPIAAEIPFDSERSIVAEKPIVVDKEAPKNNIGKNAKPPRHNAVVSQLPSKSAAKTAMKDTEEDCDVQPAYVRGVGDEDDMGECSPYTSADDEHWSVPIFKNGVSYEMAVSPGAGKGCVMKRVFTKKQFVIGKEMHKGKGCFVKVPADFAGENAARALLVQQRMTVLAKQLGTSSTFVNQESYIAP